MRKDRNCTASPLEEATKPAAVASKETREEEQEQEQEEEEFEVLDIVRKSQNGNYLREQADLAMQCKLRDSTEVAKKKMEEESGLHPKRLESAQMKQRTSEHATSLDRQKTGNINKGKLLGQQKMNPIVPYLDDAQTQSIPPQPRCNNNNNNNPNRCIPSDHDHDDDLNLLTKVVSRRCSGEHQGDESISGESCQQQQSPNNASEGLDHPSTTTLDRSNRLQLPGAFMGTPGDNLRRASVIPFSLVGSTTNAPDPAAVMMSSSNMASDYDVESQAGRISMATTTHTNNTAGSQAFSYDPSILEDGSGDFEEPVANPVTDEEPENLPRAERLFGGARSFKTGGSSRGSCGNNKACVVALLALPFLASFIILLGIFVLPNSNAPDLQEQAEVVEDIPLLPAPIRTSSPSQTPTTLLSPEQDYVLQLLPQDTKEKILQEDGYRKEPQQLAFEWMIGDENLIGYTNETIVQRFSLATLFFATDGQKWERNTNWLSYNHHECEWYANDFQKYAETNPYVKTFPLVAHLANATYPCGEDWHNRTIDNDDEGQRSYKLGQHYQYTRLWLWKNGLKGTIPQELYLLTGLRGLQIKFNDLVGSTISSHIGKLSRLEILSVGGAEFRGSIPTQIGLLTNMHTIHTAKTAIEGKLPSQLGLLKKMEALAMDESQHTGTIPTELGAIKSLLVMRLQQNQLKGPIPSQLGSLTKLQDLSLQENRLTGTLPTELESISPNNNGSLMALHLGGGNNSFSGTISDQFCDIGVNITCTIEPAFPCGFTFDCSDNFCGCGCPCAD